MKSIEKLWQDAYDKAEYYKSDRNSEAFWDTLVGKDGLINGDHITLLLDELHKLKVFDNVSTICDIGCGSGNYTVMLAEKCDNITAFDSSRKMLDACADRCSGFNNVNYVYGDFELYDFKQSYDMVVACLNPATYNPICFQKMIDLSDKYFVYMSMDIPMIVNELETEYCGANSIEFAEKYLAKHKIQYKTISYVHHIQNKRSKLEIPFKFLIGIK